MYAHIIYHHIIYTYVGISKSQEKYGCTGKCTGAGIREVAILGWVLADDDLLGILPHHDLSQHDTT